MFWTPGEICHCKQASWLACNGFLRFNSGVTPADFLAVSMAAEPFDPNICTRVQVLVGLKLWIVCRNFLFLLQSNDSDSPL